MRQARFVGVGTPSPRSPPATIRGSDAGGDSTVFVQSLHYNFSASPSLLDMQSLTGTPWCLVGQRAAGPGRGTGFHDTIPAKGLAPGAMAQEKELIFGIADLHTFHEDVPRSATVA